MVRSALGGRARVIRVMPNTPAQLRRGVSAIAIGEGASEDDAQFAVALFESVGEVVRVDESMIDAFTALAGSGPAYVFYLAEAMMRAGVEIGFDEATADRIVRGTIAGSAALLSDSTDRKPIDLRAAVTSKGGTTFAATQSLDASGAMDAIVRAIIAARDRGRELGSG